MRYLKLYEEFDPSLEMDSILRWEKERDEWEKEQEERRQNEVEALRSIAHSHSMEKDKKSSLDQVIHNPEKTIPCI
jgi:hypothetical protein